MKLKNTTKWPDHFLRRMVAWCCKQAGVPVRSLRHATFRNGYDTGHYKVGKAAIVVSALPGHLQLGALVDTTAHEVQHHANYLAGDRLRGRGRWKGTRGGGTEKLTCHYHKQITALFMENREALITEWSREPTKRTSIKLTTQEKNEARARKLLANWERKLKLAKTKVLTYRRRTRYYDAVAAKSNKETT